MVSKTKRSLIPAAAYIRMSGDKQERSPTRQRSILKRLAECEGCEIVIEYRDEGIPGDSGCELRGDFRRMTEDAERGLFQVVLAENQDRLSRRNSVKGLQLLDRIIDSGVRIITDAEGEIDLDSFEGRVVATVRQEAKHAFLIDLSKKVSSGLVDTAKAGYCCGGPPRFALDRALVDPQGNIVRRLQPGEVVRIPGHRVKLVPCQDENKLAAVRFGFERFASCDIGYHALAREMNARGFPSPRGRGWYGPSVEAMLKNPVYAGVSRWGQHAGAKYTDIRGDKMETFKRPVMTKEGKPIVRRKQPEDAICKAGAYEAIIPVKLFDKVQRKIEKRLNNRIRNQYVYSLSGLVYCAHCGELMHGKTRRTNGRRGCKVVYEYPEYLCSTYSKFGPPPCEHNPTCHHHTVSADRLEKWIVPKLQEAFLGVARDELVEDVKAKLEAEARTNGKDTTRLEKRARELDAEIQRLRKAIRKIDDEGLVADLAQAKQDRQRVQDELQRASRLATPADIQAEAEAVADEAWAMGEALQNADLPELRELFQELIERIDCRFETVTTKGGRKRTRLVDGEVVPKDTGLFVLGGHYAKA
jgi:DNA invertase Pin-like site-specific DNA recombinase